MTDINKILDRVRKLLALSNHNNSPEEAAAAAAAAQDLIAKYDLRIDEEQETAPEPDEPIMAHRDDPVESAGRISEWKVDLIRALTRENACRFYFSGRRVILIGRQSDVGKVHYLYGYLKAEVDRLTKAMGRGHGRTWGNSFRLGCASAIAKKIWGSHKRLAEAEKKRLEGAGADSTALVRVDNALAKFKQRAQSTREWEAANMKYGAARSSGQSNFSAGGYAAGKAAGATVNVGSARTRGALKS